MLDAILAFPNLCTAWERVADNRGSPGPDQVSITRFARAWEDNLRRLQELVRTRRYRPGGLRRVAIPKRGGGQRLLSIPNIGDRVLQRAVLNILEPYFDRRFLPCSYGYRPRLGLRQALAAILQLRDAGQHWVLDADIEGCFDNLDHGVLRGLLAPALGDDRVLALLAAWLGAGCRSLHPARGIAQGMPISPLLCNIYLHELDRLLVHQRWNLVRYADDLIICCASRDQAEQAHAALAQDLAKLKLRLNLRKTTVTTFAAGFDFLGVRFEGDHYVFTWEDKRFAVSGPAPDWLWQYAPAGYT